MIKKIEVQWSSNGPIETYILNEDLNVFTGRNGCGKTTIMKLFWYAVSSNFSQLLREINFYLKCIMMMIIIVS